MMKLRKSPILLSLFIIVFLILFPNEVFANPVPFPSADNSNTYSAIFTFFVVFLITIVVELVVFHLFLRKNMINYSLLNKSIIAINAFTFPITQLMAIFFLIQSIFLIGQVLMIELIPITLECLFFLKIFNILSKNDQILRYKISEKKIILTTIFANISTFFGGILMQLPLYF